MRITAKGQVTIPRYVRERAGLKPGTDVEFEIEAGVVRLVKARAGGRRRTPGAEAGRKPARARRLRDDDR